MVSEKATGIPSSVDNTSPNPAYESSTMCPQDDDTEGTDVIYELISKQISMQIDHNQCVTPVSSAWLMKYIWRFVYH